MSSLQINSWTLFIKYLLRYILRLLSEDYLKLIYNIFRVLGPFLGYGYLNFLCDLVINCRFFPVHIIFIYLIYINSGFKFCNMAYINLTPLSVIYPFIIIANMSMPYIYLPNIKTCCVLI